MFHFPPLLVIQRGNYFRADSLRGCTVLLRGGTLRELAKVKRILSRLLLLKSNARYEKAFLLTEYSQVSNFDSSFKSYEGWDLRELTLSPFVRIKAPEGYFHGHENEDDQLEEPQQDVEVDMTPAVSTRRRAEEPALVTAILTTGIEDRKVRNMLADFRSKSDARLAVNNAINNRYFTPSLLLHVNRK